MHRFLPFIFLLTWMSFQSHAQVKMMDSIKQAMQAEPKPVFGLASRISMINGNPYKSVKLYGGWDYNRKFRVELGYNFSWQPVVDVRRRSDGSLWTRVNRLRYVGVQPEYTFYETDKWRFTWPLQLGIGVNSRTTTLNAVQTRENWLVVPLETGVNAVYYFNSWFGVKGGLGNRLSFGRGFSALSGPYYNFGLAFDFEEILKMVR